MRNRILLGLTRLLTIRKSLLLLLLLAAALGHASWPNVSAHQAPTEPRAEKGEIWQDVNRAALTGYHLESLQPARSSRTLKLNRAALLTRLQQAPLESSAATSEAHLTLPLPDGSFAQFRLEESSVLPAPLAAKYPAIKSYRGLSLDKPGAFMRCDWSPRGLHATILWQAQWISIHPLAYDNADYYVSYYGSQVQEDAAPLRCQVDERKHFRNHGQLESSAAENVPLGPIRRTYRLALATTVEYTNHPTLGGGSIANTMATLNTWVNALNVIYEKEFSVRFVLANNNDQVIFTAEPDGLTDGDNNKMVDEIRPILESKLGLANYDLGQVLSPGSGGLAYIAEVCSNNNFKGGGVTLVSPSRPVGTGYGLITLAHEIGHQFSARHTFSDTLAAACNSSQFPDNTAYESFGGLTIMSYAEACTRIVWLTSPHFHSGSYAQISAFINADGGACATTANTGNQSPTINVGMDYTIPRGTPFMLTATGSDPDASDVPNLTYSWEQLDAGTNPPSMDGSVGPLFRPFAPTANPVRTFPSLAYILNNANVPPDELFLLKTAETLPNVARTMNFRCLIRDGRGGVNNGSVVLTVANAGPFLVTAPNTATTWTGGAMQTVTWSVNNTNNAPINCQNVKISLSTDGGNTFPIVLAASVPNTGTANVIVPTGLVSAQARLKVEAVNNIFFDISDANFNLTPGDSCPAISSINPTIGAIGSSVTINGANFTGVSAVKFANNVNANFTVNSDTQITATVPNGAVNGFITITKTGCSDKTASVFTVINNAAYLSQADDGSIESSSRFGNVPQVHFVNRLTPTSYPATLTAISLFIPNSVAVGTDYRLVIGLNTSGNSNIDGLALQEIPIKTPSKNQFVMFPVPNTTINSGDFVVGFAHIPQDGVFPVGIDTNSTVQNRSYYSFTGGASYDLVTNRNYAIRAVIAPGALCSPPNCGLNATLEADVSPRSNGNGAVSIADWTQVGRFVAGLDTVAEGSELQRADCAPRASFGDGKITITDWVQAGRYAAGLDPVANAAGPTTFANSLRHALSNNQLESTRVVRAVSRSMLRGQVNSVPLQLNATGDENALGFTLTYDPKRLSFYRAVAPPDTTLTVNLKQAANGQLGILLARPAGQAFPAGLSDVVTLEFIPNGGEEDVITKLGFGDQVIAREAADGSATSLPNLTFTDAEISISGRAAAHVSAASYAGANAATDSIVSAFGTSLAIGTQAATTSPLPSSLGGTSVTIKDRLGVERNAPLFFVSPNQINYLIPAGTADGLATVTITNAVGLVSRGIVNIERVAPGIFSADASGRGYAAADVQRLRSDGTEYYERVARFDPVNNRFVANPIALLPNEQAFLVLYGTGLKYRSDLSAVKAWIGGIETEVLYVGPQGHYAGLDQINLRLPRSLAGRGEVIIELEIDGHLTNPVKLSIQ